MQLGEKIAFIRTLKGLSQEEMAEKLNMSTTGYAKIERDETKLQNPRLEKILAVLELELTDILKFNAENVFNALIQHNSCLYSKNYSVYINAAVELTQELEKMRIELSAKLKEIELLNEQITQLKEINGFLKKQIGAS